MIPSVLTCAVGNSSVLSASGNNAVFSYLNFISSYDATSGTTTCCLLLQYPCTHRYEPPAMSFEMEFYKPTGVSLQSLISIAPVSFILDNKITHPYKVQLLNVMFVIVKSEGTLPL